MQGLSTLGHLTHSWRKSFTKGFIGRQNSKIHNQLLQHMCVCLFILSQTHLNIIAMRNLKQKSSVLDGTEKL